MISVYDDRPVINRQASQQRPLKQAYAAEKARFSGRCF